MTSGKHPCKAGPDGTPCNRFRRGEAYDISRDCRLCWLFAHDISYNLNWGGDGKVAPAPSAPAVVSAVVPKPMLLGDKIESSLARVGVTKERIAKLFGGCGGCTKRQKLLNDLHQWARDSESQPIQVAVAWLDKLIGD